MPILLDQKFRHILVHRKTIFFIDWKSGRFPTGYECAKAMRWEVVHDLSYHAFVCSVLEWWQSIGCDIRDHVKISMKYVMFRLSVYPHDGCKKIE